MHIRKRGKKSYEITVSNGYDSHGKKISLTTSYSPEMYTASGKPKSNTAIMKEVQAFAAEFERKVRTGEYSGKKEYVFSDFRNNVWKPEWAEIRLSIRSQESYQTILDNIFGPKLDKKRIAHINTMEIQSILNEQYRQGKSVKTLKRYMCAINSVLRFAYRMELLDKNPCDRLELPKNVAPKEVECFNTENLGVFLKSLDEEYVDHYEAHDRWHNGKKYHVPAYDEVHSVGTMWKALFYLAIVTGMRRGESVR